MQSEVPWADWRREQAFEEGYLDQTGGWHFAGVGASLRTKELGACLKGPPWSDWKAVPGKMAQMSRPSHRKKRLDYGRGHYHSISLLRAWSQVGKNCTLALRTNRQLCQEQVQLQSCQETSKQTFQCDPRASRKTWLCTSGWDLKRHFPWVKQYGASSLEFTKHHKRPGVATRHRVHSALR